MAIVKSEKYVWNSATNTWDLVVNPDSLFYIAGTGSTAGTWLGSHSRIGEYYDGLTIAYKIPVAGASITTLNINGLGARRVRRNTSNMTTHLPVNTVVLLTYITISGTGYWVWADYDSTRSLITQAAIDTGTETTTRSINALLLRNNFYLKSEADALLDGKAESGHAHTWAQITSKPTWIGSSKPTYNLGEIAETTTYKRVTQSDKDTWNGKQNALGYTPENAANKRTSIRTEGANNTSYVSELGVKNYVDGLIDQSFADYLKRDGTNAMSGPLLTPSVISEHYSFDNFGLDRAAVMSKSGGGMAILAKSGDETPGTTTYGFYLGMANFGGAKIINLGSPSSGTDATTKSYVDGIVDGIAATKQDVLGYTPVPTTRTIAGLNLTTNRSRDAILGVSTNGYYRRTGTNTYDVRTVNQLQSDLNLGSAAYTESTAYKPASYAPTWSEITSKPTWIGANKPTYNLGEIAETTTYKRVSQSEKNAWNAKQTQAQVEALIGSYDTNIVSPALAGKLTASAKGETTNKTLSFGSTFKVLQTLSNGTVNERTMTMPNGAVPTYTYLGQRTSTGSQIITNASEYKMFYIQFTVFVDSLNYMEFTRGFFANNQSQAVGVNFFDYNNAANVFLNAYMTSTSLYVHDQGEMPFNMISGTKSFSISVYGVKFE